MTREQDTPGRVAGIDYGTKRVGVAISDPRRVLSSPLMTLERQGPEADAAQFRKLVADEDVSLFVVGLPLHMSGDESQKSREARAFGNWLHEVTSVPVEYFDERFSSKEADAVLDLAGTTSKKRKLRRDMVAAHVILTSYLESLSSSDETR